MLLDAFVPFLVRTTILSSNVIGALLSDAGGAGGASGASGAAGAANLPKYGLGRVCWEDRLLAQRGCMLADEHGVLLSLSFSHRLKRVVINLFQNTF